MKSISHISHLLDMHREGVHKLRRQKQVKLTENVEYRNSFNVSATIFFYFSLFGDFQSDLSGHGNPLDDATPTFISDSGSSILGLSNDISFVSEFLLEGGKNSQKI